MPLTEVDKRFLLKMKSMGLGKEEAVEKLKQAKGGSPNESTSSTPIVSMVKEKFVEPAVEAVKLKEQSPTVSIVSDQIKGAQVAEQEAVNKQKLVEQVQEAGLAPIKSLADFGGEMGVEAGATILEGIANLVNLVTPQLKGKDLGDYFSGLANMAREGKQMADKETDFETRAGEIGKTAGKVVGTVLPVLTGAGAGAKLGTALGTKLATKAAPWLQKAVPFATGSVGATTGAEAVATGELPTAGELATGGIIDIATMGLGKVVKKIWPNLKTPVVVDDAAQQKVLKAAERSGLSELEINTVKNLPVEKQDLALQLLEQAQKSASQLTEGGLPVPTPFNVVADDLVAFQSKLDDQIDSVGKLIGKEKTGLKGFAFSKLSFDDLKRQFEEMITNRLGVKIIKGVPSYGGSAIDGMTPDQALINDMWKFLSTKKSVPADEVLYKIRNLNAKLYKGARNVEITEAKAPIEVMRQQLRELLNSQSGKLGKYSKQYAELLDAQAQLNKAIQEEGVKGAEFLRRLFGRASGPSRNMVKQIQEIAAKYGIKEGTDLFDKAAIATIIEQVAGVRPPQGFSGQIETVLDNLPTSKRDIFNNILNWTTSKLVETPTKVEALEQVIKMGEMKQVNKNAILPVLNKLPEDIAKPLRALLFTDED